MEERTQNKKANLIRRDYYEIFSFQKLNIPLGWTKLVLCDHVENWLGHEKIIHINGSFSSRKRELSIDIEIPPH